MVGQRSLILTFQKFQASDVKKVVHFLKLQMISLRFFFFFFLLTV